MKKQNNCKRFAFTIPEALVLLLIATLIAVATVPAITKKHKKVEVHGKWTCTVDNNGSHWVMTEYNGQESNFVNTGTSCVFTPPADAESFTIRATAGGGSGAAGKTGDENVLFDSDTDSETYVKSVERDGYYAIYGVGGGGAGGGMSCGEANNYASLTTSAINSFERSERPDNDWNWDPTNQTTKSGSDIKNVKSGGYASTKYSSKTYTYGYEDFPVSGFNYNLLIENDERYTQDTTPSTTRYDLYDKNYTKNGTETKYNLKYNYLEDKYKERRLCFATGSTIPPFSKKYKPKNLAVETKGLYQSYENNGKLVCWNLPGQGGYAGASFEKNNVFLNAGQNIVANVGRGGKGQYENVTTSVRLFDPKSNSNNPQYYTIQKGVVGTSGTATTIYAGTQKYEAKGGSSGYNRQIEYVEFKNIPVLECPVKKYIGGNLDNYQSELTCTQHTGIDLPPYAKYNACSNKKGCIATKTPVFHSCTSTVNPICSSYKTKYACESATVKQIDEDGNEVTVSANCQVIYQNKTTCTMGTHQGPMYEASPSDPECRVVVKAKYFRVPACVSSNNGDLQTGTTELQMDMPGLFGTKSLFNREWYSEDGVFSFSGSNYLKGELGSGGYGVGETTRSYVDYDQDGFSPKLHGENGQNGYASVRRISYAAGGGGQAGQYTSIVLKKTGKLTITVGMGGKPGTNGLVGEDGGRTVIKNANDNEILSLNGGKAGLAESTEASMASSNILGGVNGALSPFESPYNKARVIPYGGRMGTNYSYNGISPNTPKWCNENGYAGLLVTSYGAGGGGGAASSSKAGAGGFGAPGAVVIEW